MNELPQVSIPTSPVIEPVSPITLVVTGPTSLVRHASNTSTDCTPQSPIQLPVKSRASAGSCEKNHLLLPRATSSHRHGGNDLDGALSDSEVSRPVKPKPFTVGPATGRKLFSTLTTKPKKRESLDSLSPSISGDITPITSPQKASLAPDSISIVSQSQSGFTNWRNRFASKKPTRRISCKDLGTGECRGWLMKKKEKKWVKRWCVLHKGNLYYYKTELYEAAEGVIHMPGFKVSPATTTEVKNKKFAFKVHNTGMTFFFAAERQDDMAKWMNKMALATLSNLKLDDRAMTAGFWKPASTSVKSASNLDLSRIGTDPDVEYYSEETDDNSSIGSQTPSLDNSKEDLTDLYRNICRADLDLAGTNVKDRRSTVLLTDASRSGASTKDPEHSKTFRRLLSLKRTLKDKEQTLALIDDFFSSQKPITTEALRAFVEQHPHVASADDDTQQRRGSINESSEDGDQFALDSFNSTSLDDEFHEANVELCKSPIARSASAGHLPITQN